MDSKPKTTVTIFTKTEKFKDVFNLFNVEHLTFDDHMRLYLWLMKAIGLSCLEGDYYSTLDPVYGMITFLFIIYNIVSSFSFISKNLDEVADVTECLTTTFLAIGCLGKMATYLVFKDGIKDLLDQAKTLFNDSRAKREEEWKIMRNRIKEARIVSRVIYFGSLLVSFAFLVRALLNISNRKLPLAQDYIGIPREKTPQYHICFILHIWAISLVIHLLAGYEAIFFYFLLVLCAHIEILHLRISKIGMRKEFYGCKTDEEFEKSTQGLDLLDDKYTSRYLGRCIRMHQNIFNFADMLNSIYKIDCLDEVVFSTLVGCVSLYQVTESDEVAYNFYSYLACCILQIFAYCWYGDLIYDKSMMISKAVFESPWFRMKTSEKKTIHLMLLRTQKPICLTAIFAVLNLECFTSVLRATFSYYTFLTTANEE